MMEDDQDVHKDGEDDSQQEEKAATDLSNSAVVTKYQCAAGIVNRTLQAVIAAVMKGGILVDICQFGDEFIMSEVKKVYGKGKIEKGIAFPTSLSVNHLAGHFSPLAGDKTVLNKGDLVKIDIGVHIDGFAALVAHTVVIPDSTDPVSGRKADVISACYTAGQAALRLIVPGGKNTDVTKFIMKSAETFHCQPLQGVLSHELKQFVIDGSNTILGKVDIDQGIKVDEFEFKTNQVYAIDIVMSTGEGKIRELDEATTVYKREIDNTYNLKMKAARYVLGEINTRFPTFPFTLRALEDKRAKLGIVECIKHDLVQSYPVLYEREGEFVAQLKFTVLLMPSGTMQITGLPDIDLSQLKTSYAVEDEELKNLLAQAVKRKNRRKKKKNKSKKSEDVEMSL